MNKEFGTITNLLGKNGDPKHIIENQRKKFLDEKTNIRMPNSEAKEQPKFVFFRLLYIGKTSKQIQNEIRRFLRKTNKFKLIKASKMNWRDGESNPKILQHSAMHYILVISIRSWL